LLLDRQLNPTLAGLTVLGVLEDEDVGATEIGGVKTVGASSIFSMVSEIYNYYCY
jgi:hypothetical protein